jgi:uncharacterized protein
MSRTLENPRGKTVIQPSEQQCMTDRRKLADSAVLAAARQQRADHVRHLVVTGLRWWAHARAACVVAAIALGSAALVIGYATLLSWEGVPASALTLSAVLLASTVSSIAGFAFSAVCGAMLLQTMSDPVQVVEIMMVCSIAIQSLSVLVLWRGIDWRVLLPFLVGGAVGLPFGVWLLMHVGHVGFREVIGVLLIGYAAYALVKQPISIGTRGALVDACVGFVGGITGGLAAFPGAAVTIWCGMMGWEKQQQRGIYQPFILIMQILALTLIELMRGSATGGTRFHLDPLQFIPAALLGTWLGLMIFRRISEKLFARMVNLLLIVSGIGLVV